MTPVRVGVVGVGHLGYHHARLYGAMEGVELVGAADPDAARLAEVAQAFGARPFQNVESLIEAGVDAASIAAPTRLHAALATVLLEAGVDVLVEKPIAASAGEAEAMVRLADARGRVLQVGHVERFNGAVEALLRAVTAPRFIECHRLSPYARRGHDVSVVHDLMIHDLEIVRALAPGDVVSVDAAGVAVFSETPDIANARLRFSSGCVANLTCSRVSLEKLRKIRVFEADAYVSTNYSEQEVLVYRKPPGPAPPDVNPMSLISVEALTVDKEEPLKRELASFIDCVRTRRTPIVSGQDGLAALRLVQDVMGAIREHT